MRKTQSIIKRTIFASSANYKSLGMHMLEDTVKVRFEKYLISNLFIGGKICLNIDGIFANDDDILKLSQIHFKTLFHIPNP